MYKSQHLQVALWLLALLPTAAAADGPRETLRFDSDWRFTRGDIAGGQAAAFDDRQWRPVDLPHDWSIEDLPPEADARKAGRVVSGPFDSEAPGGINTGFTVGGVGWYRKHFKAPSVWRGKLVSVQFDAVYMNSDVWINGQHLGNHPSGYTPLVYDLSKYLRFGNEDNVLAVQVKNLGLNSRWYSGSGIYRHVWLIATTPIHIAQWGPTITTPKAEADGATVSIRTAVINASGRPAEVFLRISILDSQAKTVASQQLPARKTGEDPLVFDQLLQVDRPGLWSPETPNLYKAVTELRENGRTIDRVETTFGIRSLRFDSEKGFFLNGERVRLKGGCVHDNNGALGAAAYDRAEQRRVELLKAAGFNIVRGHNAPSPAFLEACDRLGLMVLEEAFDTWLGGKLPDDYHLYFNEWWRRDLTSMIERDRNHPSVVLWSIGNPIGERGTPQGAQTARELAPFVRSLDPTRLVTANIHRINDGQAIDPLYAALDIAGYGYARDRYVEDHQRLPKRLILATESSVRDCFDYWMQVEDLSYLIGNFVWTAFDYMGEASLGWLSYGHKPSEVFPWNVAWSGDLDINGFRRPQSYYRDVLWKHGTGLSTFVRRPKPSYEGPNTSPWGWDDVTPSWTWPGQEGKPLQVDVYSAHERVRLTLNGRDLGTKPASRDTQFKASWQISYEPGVLTAVGYDKDREVARSELRTAGTPWALRLTADRSTIQADGQDLSYITVEVVDANGLRHPDAEKLLSFSAEGEGALLAVGSSRPNSIESFRQPRRTTYEGRCLAILKSTRKPGRIRLTARAEGLVTSTVEVRSVGAAAR